jgi:Fe-S cluster assembly scaffold protein SufB
MHLPQNPVISLNNSIVPIYTKEVAAKQTDGYFVRAAAGVESIFPLQACLFTGKERLSQNVHNIVIVEEGAELHIITGCSTAKDVRSAMHLGVPEFYVKWCNTHIHYDSQLGA